MLSKRKITGGILRSAKWQKFYPMWGTGCFFFFFFDQLSIFKRWSKNISEREREKLWGSMRRIRRV